MRLLTGIGLIASLVSTSAIALGVMRPLGGERVELYDGGQRWIVQLAYIQAPSDGDADAHALRDLVQQRCIDHSGTTRTTTFIRTVGQTSDGTPLVVLSCDGSEVNIDAVQRGYATAALAQQPPNVYLEAEFDARQARRGVWSRTP